MIRASTKFFGKVIPVGVHERGYMNQVPVAYGPDEDDEELYDDEDEDEDEDEDDEFDEDEDDWEDD